MPNHTPPTPARTVGISLQIHLPEGARLHSPIPEGLTEAQHLADLLTHHLQRGYLPLICDGGKTLPACLAVAKGGAL